jgi:hypothetical protein
MPFKATLAHKLIGISLVIPMLALLLIVRAFLWERNLRFGPQRDSSEHDLGQRDPYQKQPSQKHHHQQHSHKSRLVALPRDSFILGSSNPQSHATLLWLEAKDAFFCALPMIVWLTFFLSIPISSFAFLPLRTCDCVDVSSNGSYTKQCFMHADYSVSCHTKVYEDTKLIASVSVIIYAVAMPTVFAWMLFKARKSIQGSARDTRYSLALSFLYREYRNGLWFWELIIFVTKLILVGFLSLPQFQPGHPLQLLIALAVTLGVCTSSNA